MPLARATFPLIAEPPSVKVPPSGRGALPVATTAWRLADASPGMGAPGGGAPREEC